MELHLLELTEILVRPSLLYSLQSGHPIRQVTTFNDGQKVVADELLHHLIQRATAVYRVSVRLHPVNYTSRVYVTHLT